MPNSKLKIYSIIIVCLFSFESCQKIAEAIFSDEDDLEMGASIDNEIRTKAEQFQILENPDLQNYVQSIVKKILRSPAVKKKQVYSYKITILEDNETINAFCTPGGYIYVYTGLLLFLENEASLAAILAHEIAHAEKRHIRQRMLSAMGLQLILSALLGNDSSVFKELGLQFAGSLAILSNSRSDEQEADELGFIYLKSSPYYQGSMSYFFEKIAKEEKRNPMSKAFESLLSSHPIPEKRLQENSNRIRKGRVNPPIPSNVLESRYKTIIKKHLLTDRPIINE